ncbi:MAG: protoporphyrinogen oxidase [Armatimonadota bacterium]|nr:protoporphyrinogen oxidase [Armatimonadota bacterium]MDR7549176.1 protoporphyrinogen oxidase [Armatimonadota bacterium]
MSGHLVIIGGGITGMAAAYAFATDPRAKAAGMRCTLIEGEPRLGGKVRTERVGECLIEHGPDSFLATKPQAADLCRALGLGDRLIGTTPGRAVYVAYRGRLHPLPDGMALGIPTRVWPLVRTGLLSPGETLRAAADLVLPRRRASGDETVGAFIRRRLGGAVADRLAGPLLGGIYAGDPDRLSLRATFPMLADWEAVHRSLVLAALARQRNAHAGGAETTPRAARSEGTGGGSIFLSLVGGLSELVEHLGASLEDAKGVTLLVGRTARRVLRRIEAGRNSYLVDLDDGRTLSADALLLAAPAFASAALLEPLAPQAASSLRAIPYVSTATVTLAYRRDTVRHPLDGHGFVVARGEPLAITACTWASSKWAHRAPPDLVLLRCYLGAAGREAIVEEDDAHLVGLARTDLRVTMGIEADPVFARVARWSRAMPQYLPGHLERLEAIEASLRTLPHVALAGAGYRGIGIPDCIRQGTEAARRLVDEIRAA